MVEIPSTTQGRMDLDLSVPTPAPSTRWRDNLAQLIAEIAGNGSLTSDDRLAWISYVLAPLDDAADRAEAIEQAAYDMPWDADAERPVLDLIDRAVGDAIAAVRGGQQ